MYTLFLTSPYFLVSVVVVFVTLWLLGTKNYNYWRDKGVIHRAPTLPFLGNLGFKDFLRSNTDLIMKLYTDFPGKSYSGFYFLTTPVLVVRDPALATKILVTDFSHFVSRGFHTNENTDPLSKNLIHINGKGWKHARPRLTAPFGLGKLKLMVEEMDDFAKKTVELIRTSSKNMTSPISAVEISDKYMIDVVASCAFGLKSNTIENPKSEFYEVCMRVFDGYHFFLHAFIGFLFPKLHRLARMTVARRYVTDFFTVISKENTNLRSVNGIERKDFFQALLHTKDQQSKEKKEGREDSNSDEILYDEEFIAANTFMFFTAGFDSSAKSSSFCFYELAANEVIQTRARDEIVRILRKYDNKLTLEALHDMVYLDQIVSEANRKYPILSTIFRKCDKLYELPDGGYVEPGIPVIIPSSAIHHDPNLYPNPEVFDPERFNEENKAKRLPGSYLPFGMGPRVCPAWQFAFIEIKVLLVRTLAEYKLTLHSSTDHPLKLHPRLFLLNPEKDIQINLSRII